MPNSLKSHIETLQEMFALAANERRMKEADALASAIESLSRQGATRASEAGDWVLVPREPTKAMIDAALAVKPLGQFYPGHTAAESEYMNEKYHGGERRANIYAAMIAAAPAPVVGDDARDAARYRWLRDVSVPPHNFYISVPVEFHDERYTPAQVDAAIDQAIESALTGANTQQNQSPTPPA